MIGFGMIQLTKQGLVGSVESLQLEQQFDCLHVFRLRRLLAPELVQFVSSRLGSCTWTTTNDGDIARESAPGDPIAMEVLNFAVNTPRFLDIIRGITRCHEIASFGGRIYRMLADGDHFDSWHADIGSTRRDRLVGMSINLGPIAYEGGVFRLRDEATGKILCELPNCGQGDAIFFRISQALKHMVTPLGGDVPKTAFAGWFRSGETGYYTDLQRRVRTP